MANQHVERADVYARVTDQIVRAIEQGAPEWEMPWNGGAGALLYPTNAATGRRYRGVNVLSLWAEGRIHAYSSPVWATFNQWLQLGHPVQKGARATIGVLWKPIEADEEAEAAEGRRWFAKAFHLFNADQVDGYAPPRREEIPEPTRVFHADRFFANTGMDVLHGGNRAGYVPERDLVLMPPFKLFRDPTAYYATLAHEATHWTGHKERLDRDLSGRFASNAYAMEELVAELGAAFLCADFALALEARLESAAYLQNWLQVLKADSRAIFAAAGHAQQAADLMHSLQPQDLKPDLVSQDFGPSP